MPDKMQNSLLLGFSGSLTWTVKDTQHPCTVGALGIAPSAPGPLAQRVPLPSENGQ